MGRGSDGTRRGPTHRRPKPKSENLPNPWDPGDLIEEEFPGAGGEDGDILPTPGPSPDVFPYPLPEGKRWIGSGHNRIYWAPQAIEIKETRKGSELPAPQIHNVRLINETELDARVHSIAIIPPRGHLPLIVPNHGILKTRTRGNPPIIAAGGGELPVDLIWTPKHMIPPRTARAIGFYENVNKKQDEDQVTDKFFLIARLAHPQGEAILDQVFIRLTRLNGTI